MNSGTIGIHSSVGLYFESVPLEGVELSYQENTNDRRLVVGEAAMGGWGSNMYKGVEDNMFAEYVAI